MSSTLAVVAAALGLAGWALFYGVGIAVTQSRTRRPAAKCRNPNE
jgi:hypothetical protein